MSFSSSRGEPSWKGSIISSIGSCCRVPTNSQERRRHLHQEAALIAAGFDYRPISNVTEMPSCFSRPICEFAMFLNDHASNAERQRLLPFVVRLACADTDEVEQQRQRYISSKTIRFMSISK